jgi:hypothetical protein
MTKIKQLTFLIFIILIGFCFSQTNKNYILYTPKKCSETPYLDSFNISQSFDMNNNKFLLFGTKTTQQKNGIGIILYDAVSKQIIFEDISAGDEDFITPHFFRQKSAAEPIVFLSTIGADYTYGVSIYKFHKDNVSKIGFMDIALNQNPNESSTDPGPWTIISINDTSLNFTFSKSISTDFQGENQKNYNPGELSYQLKNEKLVKVTKLNCSTSK